MIVISENDAKHLAESLVILRRWLVHVLTELESVEEICEQFKVQSNDAKSDNDD